MSFFGELRRRNVVKVAVAYAIVGWLLIEVASVLLPTFQAPEWVMRVFSFFVIAGFPVALILSWAYEMTPEGIKLERDVAAGKSITHVTGRKLDFAIIGALVLALGFVVFDNYLLEDGDSVADVLPNSVAVLPFENMSVDPNDAFFAAGIHDEIINQVAKIQDLNVIARTSVMQYEGVRQPITEIARELNVANVLEGTVSYAGERVRIRAQLIDGATGANQWSDVFQGDISDVFAIYADISSRIADSLEAELLPAERERIARAPTESSAAYAFYLSALEARRRSFDIDRAVELLDRAIENDSDFALAHATKAATLSFRFVDEVAQAAVESIQNAADAAERLESTVIEHAERALELDPELGLAYSALGRVHLRYWRKEQTEAAFSRALALTPKDPEVLNWYSVFNSWTGNHERAIDLAQRAGALNPEQRLIDVSGNQADPYFWAGDYDTAAQIERDAVAARPDDAYRYFNLAEIEAARANYGAAIENLRLFEQLIDYEAPGSIARAAYLYSLSGRPEEAERVLRLSEGLETPPSPMHRATGHLAMGNTEESLRLFREAADNRLPSSGATLTIMIKLNVYSDPVLEQPEFVEVRSRLGFRE